MSINKIALGKAIKSVIIERKYSPVHNCHLIAALAQKILTIYKVESKVFGGFAVWRVNVYEFNGIYAQRFNGKHSVQHFMRLGSFWLEVNECIVDFSTFWLPIKMIILDSVEKRKTLIQWCPDFIWMPKTQMLSLHDVTHGMKLGANYERIKSWDDQFIRRLEFSRKLFLNGDAEHDYHLPLVSDLLEIALKKYREFE